MAEDVRHGHDIGMQREMWTAFCKLVRWSIIGIVVLLILMAYFLI